MSDHIEPTPVVVVQPRHNIASEFGLIAGKFLVGIAFTFLLAWLVQILLPIVFEVSWDYWRCFWLLFLLRFIIPRPASFQYQSNRRNAQPAK